MANLGILSKSSDRIPVVLESAIHAFAARGYLGATIADVAREAGISPAYVSKLYPRKEGLFVEALDRCFEHVRESLARGAATVDVAGAPAAGASGSRASAADILHAMGGAYAELIAERDYLLLQVHAQSASWVPEIAAAVRRGLASITLLAQELSGGTDAEVQRFIAYGQLCQLIVTTGIDAGAGAGAGSGAGSTSDDATQAPDDLDWARILTEGIRHP